MAKTIKINHPIPGRLPYALIPTGMFLNTELQKAVPGCTVEFRQDWRREKRILVRKITVDVRSSIFSFMAKSIYGDFTTIKSMREQWRAQAIREGLGRDGFDKDSCLLIEVKIDDEVEF